MLVRPFVFGVPVPRCFLGHPQVLIIVFFKKIAVILFSHARSSLCFQCACSSLFSFLLVTHKLVNKLTAILL
jgi:hypothetical protein